MRKTKMTRLPHLMLAVGAAATMAACGGDEAPLGPEAGDALSPNEAAAVGQAIVELAFQGWDFGQATAARTSPGSGEALSASVAGAPITIDHSLDVSTSCELGGTFRVAGSISGTIDDQTFAGDLELDVTTEMASCAFPAEGTSFTLDTSPPLELSGSVAWDQTGLVGQSTFTYGGGISWVGGDGRSGSCTVDVLVQLAQDGSSVTSGSVCGVSVSEQGSL